MKKPPLEITGIIIALIALLLFSIAVGDNSRGAVPSSAPSTSAPEAR